MSDHLRTSGFGGLYVDGYQGKRYWLAGGLYGAAGNGKSPLENVDEHIAKLRAEDGPLHPDIDRLLDARLELSQ